MSFFQNLNFYPILQIADVEIFLPKIWNQT